LGFILVPLAGVFFFGEHLSPMQWVGAGMIVVGIFLAGGAGSPFNG